MILCLVGILAAPAMAADLSHGRMMSPVSGRTGTGLFGRGMHIFSSLQVMAFPVVGPLALLSEAKDVIQRFTNPSSKVTPGSAMTWNFHPGLNPGFVNRTTLPIYHAFGAAQGTAAVGYEENLTAYLAGKGYDVSDLNRALTDAHAALAGSNLTALGRAMMTFRSDLNAKVTAGTINRTVIQDYLKTMPGGNRGIGAGRGPAGMPRMMMAHRMAASWGHMRGFSRSR
jgi:hypothetical protein